MNKEEKVMKKEYVKPYLALESFQLVAALAGSCSDSGYSTLNSSIDSCILSDDTLFGASCEDSVHEYPELCYQGPVNGGLYLTS